MSTLFISHKSSERDNRVATDLMARLKELNHNSLFLDLDEDKGIVGGRSWEQTLYRNVRACRAVIPLLSNDYLRSHWCFAELALARMEGKHLVALEIEPLDDELIPQILTGTQRIDLHQDPEAGYRRLFKSLEELDLLGEEGDWDPKQSPYLGLSTFEEKHAPLFFGRDDEIRVGIELLDRGAPGLVMVLGSSGSGKSSLVRAGIVPRLRRQEDRWLVVDPFRPRRDPFAELAEALAKAYRRYAPEEAKESGSRSRMRELLGVGAELSTPAGAEGGEADPTAPLDADIRVRRLLDQLEELSREPPAAGGSPLRSFLDLSLGELREICAGKPVAGTEEPTRTGSPGLVEIADELRRRSGKEDARVLLVVDQFEELLGHGASGDRPNRFLSMLRKAIETEDSPLVVLGTMRSDFLGLFQQKRELLSIDYEQLSVGPMSEDGLTRVITKPAERGALTLEEGLANLLLKDTGTPDALPLLSFTLRTLWEKRDENDRLRLDQYKQLGGIQGAIAREAQAILERHRKRENDLKRAFLEMARLTEDGHYARTPVSWGDAPIARVEEILREFVECRLLVTGQDERGESTVEVAHEALFRSWPPLAAWLDENRSEHLMKEQVRRDARAWEEGGRPAEVLWRGGRLQQAAELMRRSGPGGPGKERSLEAEFVRAGVWRQRRARMILAASVTGVFIALTILTITAERARRAAEHERTIAASRQLAAQSLSGFVLDSKGSMFQSADLSMLLGVESYRTAPSTIESRSALLSLLHRTPRLERFLLSPQEAVTARARHLRVGGLALRPGGGPLAAPIPKGVANGTGEASLEDGIVLLDPRSGEEVGPRLAAGSVYSVAFGPDGALLASAEDSGTITLWNAATGRKEHALESGSPVMDIAFDPSGEALASGLMDGTLQLWSVATRRPLLPTFEAHDGAIRAVSFSPVGFLLATGGEDGRVRLWRRSGAQASPAIDFRFEASGLVGDSAIHDVEFSSDGHLLAWTAGSGVVVWDLKERRRRHLLTADRAPLIGVAFDSKAGVLAAGSASGAVWLWDVASGELLGEPLRGHNRLVDGLTFGPDDRSLFSLSWDGSLIHWSLPDLDSASRSSLASSVGRMGESVSSLAFSPDGKLLAARDGDGLKVWEVETGRVLPDTTASIFSPTGFGDLVAFDQTGRRVAIGTDDGRVLVLDVERGELAFELRGAKPAPVLALAFSPTADVLASADGAGVLLISNSLDGTRVSEVQAHQGEVTTLAFSPNGRILVSAALDEEGIVLRDGSCGLPLGPALAPAHDPVAYDHAFSPDGRKLASVGEDKTLILWNVAGVRAEPSSSEVCPQEAGPVAQWPTGAGPTLIDRIDLGAYAASVAFNGDASLLATASSERIDLFETSGLRRLGSLVSGSSGQIRSGAVRSVAFGPKAPLLASNLAGEVLLWDLDFESWLSRLCRKANRELSSEERSRYLGPVSRAPGCSGSAAALATSG